MATIDMEQLDGVVGCFCTLLYPRRGQTEGTIVEDLGCEVIVQLINGKEVTEYKDDVVICDVIVKTCSDICFTIGQKNCQMFVAKLHNILHPHNRMRESVN